MHLSTSRGSFTCHRLFSRQFIIAMKLSCLFLFVSCLHAFSEGYAQRVTIKRKDASLEEVFRAITKQTGYTFVYTKSDIQKARPVTISLQDATLDEALKACFSQQPLTAGLIENHIVVKERTETPVGAIPAPPPPPADVSISGKVTDANGKPLENVSVQVKGGGAGTTTDAQGNFSLNVPDAKATLVISSIGYVTREVRLAGTGNINVTLTEAAASMQTVVVTALGIKREQKSLGYATATVPPDQVTVNRSSSFMNALEGKIAGVNITSLGSGPAGTSKIRIRGQSSFGGNNSPLIVVNGVPIDNTNYGARGDVSARGSNRTSDGGDGLSSIDPDNIESMTVLKGAAASALYGSRAKDGVIMITTKTRGKGNGIGIEVNTNYTNETLIDYTDYQYEYGQGENGVRPTTPFPTSGQWSFGEKFQPGMTQVLFDNLTVPYEPQRNQIKEYYRQGNSLTNSVTISSGGEFGGFSLSLANMKSTAILPGSDFDRKNLNLGFTQTFAKKLTVSGNISYSNELRNNPPNIGEQDYSPVVLYNMANSLPMELLKKNMVNAAGDEISWSRFTNRTNPYFALTRFDKINRDRFFGNLTVRYDLTKWLYLQGRLGQDFYSRSQEYNLPTGSQRQAPAPPGFVNGEYIQDERRFRELNADVLLGARRKFGNISVDLMAGGNQMRRKLNRNNVLVNDFYTRGIYTLTNGRLLQPLYEVSERQVNSVYGSAEVSYNGYLYVNGTVRNDWFSTLSPQNRSILYPSLTASFIFTEAFRDRMPAWLDYGKLRVAYAEVGSDTDVPPYSNSLFYAINPLQFPNPSGTPQSLAGINASTVPNPNLRPMRVSEKEIGLEMRMFDNLVSLELSYYDKLSSDQILQAQISDASGYQRQLVNVGESRNRGVEGMINLRPVRGRNFSWELNVNGAYNQSEVLSLGTGAGDTIITVGTGDFTGELRQVVGKPLGQLYGYGYQRNASGQQVFDAGNGRPLRTANQIAFGSAVPIWTGGITNSFTIHGVTLSALVDFKLGHKMISGTNFNAWRHGLHQATLVGRQEGYVIGNGVNPNGQKNAARSGVQAFYETVRSQNIAEEFVYNAGLWQLRQLTAGYDFTKYVQPKLKFVKGLRISAVASNVLVIKKWVPNIHPEQFGFPSDNLIGLEATGLPITRNIGFNLNLKF
jgi:TonB-linked SusC/RagA family outer membrane protein